MKDPIEIAREIVDAATLDPRRDCPLEHCEYGIDYYCTGCLRSMIAAAIVAERGAGTPHFCEIHRATSGEHDCGLSPCAEATIHKDLGPPRRVTVAASDVKRRLRRAVEDNVAARRDHEPASPPELVGGGGGPNVALETVRVTPYPACARCGGSGEIRVSVPEEPDYYFTEPCPACGGKP